MKYEIKELPREKYDYYELHYTYNSDFHYKASLSENENRFAFEFRKEPLPEPLCRDCYDTLYQEYWQDCTAYGFFAEGEEKPCAFLEVDREHWNERLVITQLLVDESKRGRGIGAILMNKAKEIAAAEDFRLITLETQTCNINAIEFYKKQGFSFSGTDLYFYSNDDISENEVMIEMCLLL